MDGHQRLLARTVGIGSKESRSLRLRGLPDKNEFLALGRKTERTIDIDENLRRISAERGNLKERTHRIVGKMLVVVEIISVKRECDSGNFSGCAGDDLGGAAGAELADPDRMAVFFVLDIGQPLSVGGDGGGMNVAAGGDRING